MTNNFSVAVLLMILTISPILTNNTKSGIELDEVIITISSNNDFVLNGFSGSGTEDDPYIITNKSFTSISTTLLQISNVNVHFIVKDCNFNGGDKLIQLTNVSNGIFIHNTFYDSPNIHGIEVAKSKFIDFIDNNFNGHHSYAFYNDQSSNLVLRNNTFENNYIGFMDSTGGSNNLLEDNIFFQNTWALRLEQNCLNYSVLHNNFISNIEALSLGYSGNNTFANNLLSDNSNPLFVAYTTGNNTFSKNSFYNSNALIMFDNTASNIQFLNNTLYKTNISDNGINNNFKFNYWYNHDNTDINKDSIADTPYVIPGSSAIDNKPLSVGIYAELGLNKIKMVASDVSNTNDMLVSWDKYPTSLFNFNSSNLELFYSKNSIKNLIDDNMYTFTKWNVSTLPDGKYNLTLMLTNISILELGGKLPDQEISTISFDLLKHNISGLTVLTPNGGEEFSGMSTIEWIPVIDTFNHTTFYDVYISNDAGVSYTIMNSNITGTSIDFDTSQYENKDSYLIKVVTNDGTSIKQIEDSSDAIFSILNRETSNTTSSTTSSKTSTPTTSTQMNSSNSSQISLDLNPQMPLIILILAILPVSKKYYLKLKSKN